uniref:Uncharacterized protein n=1 Tax=Gopherus agassizii TaxID=38772 RepID=A0A452H182_9SAUR
MGKSNSKLKPEVVEELTRKTYCKYSNPLTISVPASLPQLSRRPSPPSYLSASDFILRSLGVREVLLSPFTVGERRCRDDKMTFPRSHT